MCSHSVTLACARGLSVNTKAHAHLGKRGDHWRGRLCRIAVLSALNSSVCVSHGWDVLTSPWCAQISSLSRCRSRSLIQCPGFLSWDPLLALTALSSTPAQVQPLPGITTPLLLCPVALDLCQMFSAEQDKAGVGLVTAAAHTDRFALVETSTALTACVLPFQPCWRRQLSLWICLRSSLPGHRALH